MPQQRETGVVEREGRTGAARDVLDAYRRWGYLEADLDPLGLTQPAPHPDLPVEGEAVRQARAWYCGPIGVEFMHIADAARRRWVQERMEAPLPVPDRFPREAERHSRAGWRGHGRMRPACL
jgi:2-oxoglutarate dehydrogenase E1 component